jgi:hypothetical protein
MLGVRRTRRGASDGGGLNGDSINTLPEMWSDNILGHEDLPMEVSEVLVYPSHLKTNRHHKAAKSRGNGVRVKGRNGKWYENIAVVPIQYHEAFNMLFGSRPTPAQVCAILNRYWIDPRQTIKFYLVDSD